MTAADLRHILDRCRTGELSAPMSLMHLLLTRADPAAIEAAVAETAGTHFGVARERLEALRAEIGDERNRLAEIAELIGAGIDHTTIPGNTEAGLAACRALFDRLARDHPVAGVALYSLGSPELLAQLTGEILDVLQNWRLLSPERRVLDLGCGTGRIASALAPRVAWVIGIDLSPEMIARARTWHRDDANVRFAVGSGDSIAGLADASVDLVLAVDSFPYIVQCGSTLTERHFAEAARVLAPSGDLVIFNFSYRGLAADRCDVAELAPRYGFAIERSGVSCFALWDAAAFHLRRLRRRAQDSAPPSDRQ